MRFGIIAAVAASLLLAGCGSSTEPSALPTEGVTDALIASPPEGEWLTYGHDRGEQRFSPLAQITQENIGQLGLAWYADLETARGQEATPLMHDGVLYVTTAWSMVKAYDAKTGKLKWSYDPEVPRETLVRTCCDAVNRGVALYGNLAFVAALDGRLIALDQQTGKVVWTTKAVPDDENYTITGAPRVANGRVFIGSGGAEYRARGFLAAFDWKTGKELWRFHTVPGNPKDGFENDAMKKAADTWGGEWWKLGGGGTVWDSITYDPATNLVLFGTGNAEPWNPAANKRLGTGADAGDNLYTSSIVAVNADTGEYAWHFQETPEDRWDFDSNAQITVADVTIDGKQRHVALHAPKNGYFYILDAKTGEFISGTAQTAINWSTGLDPKTGKPTINPEAKYDETGKVFVGVPGAGGFHSWQPMSYSPQTGYMYIPANLAGFPFAAAKDWQESDIGFQTAQDGVAVAMPADKAARSAALAGTQGQLLAWDVANKKAAWTVPYAGPWNGGVLSTAGGLVFQGTATEAFNAYDAKTGHQVWSYSTQTGVIAAPMTYSIDGEQYVAIVVGWGGVWDIAPGVLSAKSGPPRNISRLLVFKLGANGRLPAPPPLNKMALDPPAFTGTAEQVAHGAGLFQRYCSVCHGDAAVAGALNPDLRRSGLIGDPKAIAAIVIDGKLQHQGMVSFKVALKPDDAEAIRQYVIKRANEDKALGGS